MSKKIWGIIVAIVIVISSVAAYWYTQKKEEKGKVIMKVIVGDHIEVNYTGRFTNGTVFDTNIESVANDNSTPKSYSFSHSSYTPLMFTVGSDEKIDGFGENMPDMSDEMIQYFNGCLLNMSKGGKKNITFTAENGYEIHEDLFIKINKTQSIPLYETISSQRFHELYPGEILNETVSFKHYFWGWNATIEWIDGDNVTIRNNPENDSMINVFGWNSTIIEIDNSYNGGEGRILLQHNPAGNITIGKEKTKFLMIDNGALNYVVSQINIGNSSVSDIGIVSRVDTGTFTIDYNPEVVGKTLIFEVTIISISRG